MYPSNNANKIEFPPNLHLISLFLERKKSYSKNVHIGTEKYASLQEEPPYIILPVKKHPPQRVFFYFYTRFWEWILLFLLVSLSGFVKQA